MKPIIEVRNLSKQYKIGQKQKYLSLRDSMMDLFKFKGRNTERSDFWALNDVSFDVYPGESIGIIGRNGAGKSTLLKILSRITPPTKGKVILRGRIASLLEVGTGFHQELSGRENVFMNGSILGLRKVEIAKKFDEIVAFSGVEQFIDTPLKHYSSGMQLRLAFAVAAHLEPEILVIDEVLAVGDAEFQKKCLGKMDDVSKSGRTVLFVSHNMGTISQLCPTTLLIKSGKLLATGKTSDIINHYTHLDQEENNTYKGIRRTYQYAYIREIKVVNKLGESIFIIEHDKEFGLKIEIEIEDFRKGLAMGIALIDNLKHRVFTVNLYFEKFIKANEKVKSFIFLVPKNIIMPGHYSWIYALHLDKVEYFEYESDICSFKIVDNGSEFAKTEGGDNGCIFMRDYSIVLL